MFDPGKQNPNDGLKQPMPLLPNGMIRIFYQGTLDDALTRHFRLSRIEKRKRKAVGTPIEDAFSKPSCSNKLQRSHHHHQQQHLLKEFEFYNSNNPPEFFEPNPISFNEMGNEIGHNNANPAISGLYYNHRSSLLTNEAHLAAVQIDPFQVQNEIYDIHGIPKAMYSSHDCSIPPEMQSFDHSFYPLNSTTTINVYNNNNNNNNNLGANYAEIPNQFVYHQSQFNGIPPPQQQTNIEQTTRTHPIYMNHHNHHQHHHQNQHLPCNDLGATYQSC